MKRKLALLTVEESKDCLGPAGTLSYNSDEKIVYSHNDLRLGGLNISGLGESPSADDRIYGLYYIVAEDHASQEGPNWAGYTLAELGLERDSAGRMSCCQEQARFDSYNRALGRGGNGTEIISLTGTPRNSGRFAYYGYRSVLELMHK